MKLNTIVFGALIALSTSALQASEVKSNGDVKQPEILASVSTDKVVPLTAREAKETRGAYTLCTPSIYWPICSDVPSFQVYQTYDAGSSGSLTYRGSYYEKYNGRYYRIYVSR